MTAVAASRYCGLPPSGPDRSQLALWASAGVAALALHAGIVALALFRPVEPQGEATPQAVMIELAPDPAAPLDEPPEIAPDLLEQMEVPETSDLPELTEPELDLPEPPPDVLPEVVQDMPPEPDLTPVPVPEPEVAIARPVARPERPEPVEKVEEKKPEEKPRQQEKRQAKAEAPREAPKVQAPTNSAAQSGGVSPARWQSRLMAHLERRKRYPAAARSQRAEGTVYVRFSLDDSGNVLSSAVTRSSGHAALDAEVLALLNRASPVPAPPPGAPRTITAPIRFNIR